ncbi:MAG: VacB/RNase II family 3'-5' exoribonuclease, partial [Phycisphaerales bacterium]|nr:VacB/RNase II family 3'-5' exoribonuclease [Phycisphaerales bacterium]
MRKRSPNADHSSWQSAIKEYIAANPDQPTKPRDIARAFDIEPGEYPAFRAAIREMLDSGTLALGRGRRLVISAAAATLTGKFRATRQGYAFLELGQPPDLFIPPGDVGDARDGDTVLVRVRRSERRPGESVAQVVRVIERAPLRWIGVLERAGERWRVRPRGKTTPDFVEILDPTAKAARAGDMVVVEPVENRFDPTRPRGVITERLGPATQTESLIRAVLRQYDIEEGFPSEVIEAARAAARTFDPQADDNREVLTDLLTFTIDPPDARDFDDAISLEELPGGSIRLGVHVADVAHFVREGEALDLEARKRATSVYFPGFVVPMLPEVLSNGVCSLQPGEPRLTRSVFITYDRQAGITHTRFSNSVIRSTTRLTYQQADAELHSRQPTLEPAVMHSLRAADDLARRIRQRRIRNGMITLNLPEVEIRLDDRGRPCDAGPADASFPHTIIEMFMVEANEAVSAFLHAHGLPHLRRVHPLPVTDPAISLRQLTTLLGSRPPRALNREYVLGVLQSVAGKPEEHAASFILLRALAQAVYSPTVQEHFALASEHYCHFTSPIRRYPDLTIHRQMDDLLRRGAAARGRRKKPHAEEVHEDLVALARHCSAMERRAQSASRDVIQGLLIELLRERIGETFDGIITSVTSYGAFVQIQPMLAEGLISLDDFGDDIWLFDDERSIMVGRRKGRVVALGQ